jgi:His-Xaa-Ser system protein HxsD
MKESAKQNFFEITKDFVKLRINSGVYSLATIYAAGYVFLDKAYILLDKDNTNIYVYLYPQDEKSNLKKLGLDFYNELLNYAHYFNRVESNNETIKVILQRAMFSVSPELASEAEDEEIQKLIHELEDEKVSKKNAKSNPREKK